MNYDDKFLVGTLALLLIALIYCSVSSAWLV